jgi:hypothetical protein
MFKRRPLLAFLVLFLPVYAVLMIPWPGVREYYRAGLIGAANIFLSCIPGDAAYRLSADSTRPDVERAMLEIQHRTAGRAELRIDSGEVAYLPTALCIALILSTPVAWKRRIRALVVGFALVNVFIMFRLGVMAAFSVNLLNAAARGIPAGRWSKAVAAFAEFIGVGPGLSCIVAVLIWMVVLIGRDDVRVFLQLRQPPSSGSRHSGSD